MEKKRWHFFHFKGGIDPLWPPFSFSANILKRGDIKLSENVCWGKVSQSACWSIFHEM